MTNEELILRSVGEIVERLVARFSAQASDHEAKMVEHRAAFGARTEADAKIIEWLRIKVQDARAERDALRAEVAALKSQTPKHPWTFANCEPCDQPATHDTEAGKAVAESAVSETVAEEIRVGDVVEVFKSSSTWTFLDDIGKSGTVSKIETDVMSERIVHLSEHPDDAFALRDVRKVMT